MEIGNRATLEMVENLLDGTTPAGRALQADRAIVMHRGEVVMDGAPEEIFSRSDELEMYNLTLPRAAYVCKKLQAAGMPVANAFTAEELAEAICASLQRG